MGVSWSCVLSFANVYQSHLPPALTCHSYVRRVCLRGDLYMCCEMCACVTAAVPPTAVYTVTHTHIRTHLLIKLSAPPRQMLLFTLRGTRSELPIGDIRRLKAKVADNLVHHVTAGRALSVADLQRHCAAPGGSPPHRLFMGHGSSVIKYPTRRDDRKVPTSAPSHRLIRIKHLSHYAEKKLTMIFYPRLL